MLDTLNKRQQPWTVNQGYRLTLSEVNGIAGKAPAGHHSAACRMFRSHRAKQFPYDRHAYRTCLPSLALYDDLFRPLPKLNINATVFTAASTLSDLVPLAVVRLRDQRLKILPRHRPQCFKAALRVKEVGSPVSAVCILEGKQQNNHHQRQRVDLGYDRKSRKNRPEQIDMLC